MFSSNANYVRKRPLTIEIVKDNIIAIVCMQFDNCL